MNKHSILALTFTMLYSLNSLNWQAAGNMSQSNLTVIREYINTNFSVNWPYTTLNSGSDTTIIYFATAFSNELNRQWDPAWNVFVVYITDKTNSDSVVYGYAFRDHWFWLNGVQMNDGYYVSIILWKDYNCIKWFNLNSFNSSQAALSYDEADSSSFYNTVIMPQFAGQAASSRNGPDTNIWQAAYNQGIGFATNAQLSSMGWTIIGSQNIQTKHVGHFCAKGFVNPGNIGTNWGHLMVIQTR